MFSVPTACTAGCARTPDSAFDGYEHERTWSIADVEIADWPYEAHFGHAFLHGDGDIGFVIPIGARRFRVVSNTPEALEQVPGDWHVDKKLRADIFRISIRQASGYQAGGAFVGGDAAHVHSPIGARGMNLGIEDAACFARRLTDGTLSGYTSERRPVGRRWVALSERMLAGAEASGWFSVPLRNAALKTLAHLPALQRPMLERLAGIRE